MSDLFNRDPLRSRAVLMGTWDYADFESVPAVENSYRRMHRLLQDPVCGNWPKESIISFGNRTEVGRTRADLIDEFLKATDVLLFYYLGHGIYDHQERLCLTVGDSSMDVRYTAATSLPFEAVGTRSISATRR